MNERDVGSFGTGPDMTGSETSPGPVKNAASKVRERAVEEVDRRTTSAGDRLGGMVEALNAAAERLEQDGQHRLAEYTRAAAGRVGKAGGYLRDEDAPAMMRDLEHMARSHPGTFLGSSFAAGLAVGRFLRSSRPEVESHQPQEWATGADTTGYGTTGAGTTGYGTTGYTGAAPEGGL